MAYFDRTAGLLNRAVFSSESIYRDEQRHLFSRCWLFVGPANWVEASGAYFTSSMGEVAVVVWCAPTGGLRLLINRCPLGNGVLAEQERGTAENLVCSCHGLAYDPDGLVDRPEIRLTPVAQVLTHRGLIFACFDPNTASFDDYLGNFAWYLDMLLNRREGGIEVIGGSAFRWVIEANWKVAAEAFAGDAYADLTLYAATNDATGHRPPSAADQGLQVTAGAGAITLLTDLSLYLPPPIIQQYERSTGTETVQRLGQERGREMVPLTATLFPNLSFDWSSRSLHIWQPRGPQRTEVNTYCFADRAAPDAVKMTMRKACQFNYGPAGLRAQDQASPWQSLTERSSHAMAGAFPLNLQMGLGHKLKRNMPGKVSDLFSEMNQRSFFSWWEDRLDEEPEFSKAVDVMRIASPRQTSAD